MFNRLYLFNVVTKRFVQRGLKFPKERPPELLWRMIENNKIKSCQDWKHIRDEILNNNGPITTANIDAMTVGTCISQKKYDLALSYLDFLKTQNVSLNLATIGKYFKLLYVRGVEETLSQENEDRILTMYDSVRKSYPVLDSLSLENVIQALSLTRKWKLCLELLAEVKVTTSPSSSSYSAIVAAAFSNNSEELAWKILNEMIESDKQIQEIVYTSYFKNVKTTANKLNALEKMFNFMQRNSLKIESTNVECFMESLKDLNIIVCLSSIYRGICKSCSKKLEVFDLTENEFSDLKTKVIQNVIVGKNVYNKTTSDELKRFKDFIASMEKYDVIVDGLNVAYSAGVKQSPQVTSGLVASVVSHFVSQGKKVLVLGRKHMSKWPKQNWNYILQNSSIFLTEDLSQDDPYLIYCALNSGKDTIIVTRDLMRSHKFLLKEVHLKSLFDRWLAQRQYILVRVLEGGSPKFKKPLPFSHIPQKIDGYWHIPCTGTNSTSNSWLCVKL